MPFCSEGGADPRIAGRLDHVSNPLEENRDIIEEISPYDVMYKSDSDHYSCSCGLELEATQRFTALAIPEGWQHRDRKSTRLNSSH